MKSLNSIIRIIILFLLFLHKILSKNFSDNSSTKFENGIIETSSSEFQKDNNNMFSNSDLNGIKTSVLSSSSSSDLSTKFRPIPKPLMTDSKWNYNLWPTAGEKINFMKTYIDPVTKLPFRYVMRKKTQVTEDDSLLNTASKIINTLLSTMDEQEILRRDYNAQKVLRHRNSGISIKHVNKREIALNNKLTNNHIENETQWLPLFIVKVNNSSQQQPILKNISEGKNMKRRNYVIYTNFNNNITTDGVINNNNSYKSYENNTKSVFVNTSSKEERNNTFNDQDNNIKILLRSNNFNDTKLDDKNSKVVQSNQNYNDTPNTEFIESLKILRKIFLNCKLKPTNFNDDKNNSNFLLSMQSCVQNSLLKAFDRMLMSDVISLNDNIFLVHDVNSTILKNNTILWKTSSKNLKNSTDFIGAICERMFRLLQTHFLQIKLWNSPNEGRRRHHYRKAFPMMVAGFMMLSAFLVPLGFQFMAMIGGKALLLSKMALMMSMLGGFRKLLQPEPIYHAPSYEHIHTGGGWHHRSTNDQPTMTLAYSKNNYGGYDSIQRDIQETSAAQHWIDPKSYSIYS